jgi:phosphotransferase system  glucose/maltose/N-acetylglucosamine-specific IIC component
MSDQKATAVLVGSVALILMVALGFGFAQDDGNPVLGAALGAVAAAAMCAVAFLRPEQDASVASRSEEVSTSTVDLRQRRNAAAWRFVVMLGAIVALWLVVFFIL